MIRRLLIALALLALPAAAAAQVSLTADRIFLGPGPCLLSTGPTTPTNGHVCDFFLNTTTGDLFQLVGGVWNDVTSNPRVNTIEARTSVMTPVIGSVQGALTLAPASGVVLPNRNFGVSFGTPTQKFLTLHLGELWAESLVAQEVLATIGGHVIVGPTTLLVGDVATSDNAITVKHNNLHVNDIVMMQDAPNGIQKLEFMRVTSAATPVAGAYRYSVTRNLDGSGLTPWFDGDAVVNTGQPGQGMIDLYALQGLLTGYGPTIVGNVRTGTNFNDLAPRWAIGNLNNVGYGHSVPIAAPNQPYGAAFGNRQGAYMYLDDANGLVMSGPLGTRVQIQPSGVATFLGDGGGVTNINGGNIQTETITANAIATNTLTTRTFAAGSITTNKLAVGNGANMIRNSECRASTVDWSPVLAGAGEFAFNYPQPYTLNGESTTCYFHVAGAPGVGAVSYAISKPFSVVGGARYEASIYFGMHRLTGSALVGFFDTSNTAITYIQGNPCPGTNGGAYVINNYCRSGVIGDAPANASYARLYAYGQHTGESDPYMFFVRAYLGQTKPNATEISEWSPAGLTEIEGGLIKTDSIVARNIAAEAITADKIAAGAITAGKIQAGSITGDQIAANTITVNNMAANSINANMIIAGNVNGGHIADGSVSGADVGDDSLGYWDIAAGQIYDKHMADGQVTGRAIQDYTLGWWEVANATLRGWNIAPSEITGGLIAAGTIVGGNIAARTIAAGNIAAANITGYEIAGNTITGGHIQSKSITSDHITVGKLDAISADLGTINAGTINGITINGTTINGSTMNGGDGNVVIDRDGIRTSGNSGNGSVKIGNITLWGGNSLVITRSTNIEGGLDINNNLNTFGGSDNNLRGNTTHIWSQVQVGGDVKFTDNGQTVRWESGSPGTAVSMPNMVWNNNCSCLAINGSSRRFKENLRPWGPPDALALLTLPLYRFDMKNEPPFIFPSKDNVGFMVEDLVNVAPEAVVRDAQQRPWSYSDSVLITYLIAGLKAVNDKTPRVGLVEELQAQVHDLQQRLAVLEAKGKDK